MIRLIALAFVTMIGCGDAVFSPESARAIPGSPDYCDDRERTMISPGSADRFRRASDDFAEHCAGGGGGEDEEKPNLQADT